MKLPVFAVLGLVAALAGCSSDNRRAASEPYREPEAPPSTSQEEIPGTTSPSDLSAPTAQSYVDDVYVGRQVDPNGEIPESQRSDSFRTGEKVVVGMEVTDAPAGSAVRVTVQDADSNNQVWTAERDVPAGRTHMHFSIDEGKLPRGKYRAKVIIGDETVAERDFEVS
jgi:hypothetical protein